MLLLLLAHTALALRTETNGLFRIERTEEVRLGRPLEVRCTWIGDVEGRGNCDIFFPGQAREVMLKSDAKSSEPGTDCSTRIAAVSKGKIFISRIYLKYFP